MTKREKWIKYTKNNSKQSTKQLFFLGLTSEELLKTVNQNAIFDSQILILIQKLRRTQSFLGF